MGGMKMMFEMSPSRAALVAVAWFVLASPCEAGKFCSNCGKELGSTDGYDTCRSCEVKGTHRRFRENTEGSRRTHSHRRNDRDYRGSRDSRRGRARGRRRDSYNERDRDYGRRRRERDSFSNDWKPSAEETKKSGESDSGCGWKLLLGGF